MTCWSDFKAN